MIDLDTEPKICYLYFPLFSEEYIGWFKIPVYYTSPLKLKIPLGDIIHELVDLILLNFEFNFLAEISFAQFGDDIGVIFGGEDIMKREDVGKILYFFEDVDF